MSDADDPPAAPAAPAAPVFSRLLGLLRPQWPLVAAGIGLLVVYVPCELFPAAVALYVVDRLIQDGDTYRWLESMISLGGRVTGKVPLLASAVTWMAAVYAFGAVAQTVSQNLMERVAQRFIFDLRNGVYAKLQSQSLTYLHNQRTGDLMSRAVGDVNELQAFVVNGIDQIVAEGLIWVVTVAWLMYLDWRVTTAMVLPLLAVYFLLRHFNAKIAPIYKAARESAGRVSARLQENLSGVVVIKIFGRERAEADRFAAATRENYDDQIRAVNARSLFFPFPRAVGFLSNVAMLGLGGYLILAAAGAPTPQSFTLGKLLAFRSVWYRLFGPIYTLARVNDQVQRASAAGRRVFEVLDAPDDLPDPPVPISLGRVRGAMELRGVTFAYGVTNRGLNRGAGVPPASAEERRGRDARATPVLRDVSIAIDPGRTVALVGPSGGGKSTVLNLLLRFYDPTAGAVTLDGTDLRDVDRADLRRHFALVQQETFLFAQSIADNLRYGRPGAPAADVIAAAKAANAHEFIARTADGYDTTVGERGVKLSGGQKQRISIARAFLADPAILLLDEPTSSVEPDSEAAIIAALERLMAGRTTVLTTHRPSLVRGADVVYVIEAGCVAASGTIARVRRENEWFERFMSSASDAEPAEGAGPADDGENRPVGKTTGRVEPVAVAT